MAKRRRKRATAPTTMRLREDVEEIVAGYEMLTGWSASECVNWLIRTGREAIEGNTKHATAVKQHIDAAAKRHAIELDAKRKLEIATAVERKTATAIRPVKQQPPSDLPKPKT